MVIIMEDLVRTNKPLKAEWERRRTKMMEMVRDLALTKLGLWASSSVSCAGRLMDDTSPISLGIDTVGPSLPRSICRELVLAILRHLPESLVDENTLARVIASWTAPRFHC